MYCPNSVKIQSHLEIFVRGCCDLSCDCNEAISAGCVNFFSRSCSSSGVYGVTGDEAIGESGRDIVISLLSTCVSLELNVLFIMKDLE